MIGSVAVFPSVSIQTSKYVPVLFTGDPLLLNPQPQTRHQILPPILLSEGYSAVCNTAASNSITSRWRATRAKCLYTTARLFRVAFASCVVESRRSGGCSSGNWPNTDVVKKLGDNLTNTK